MPHAGSRQQACLQGYQKMASWCFCAVLPNNFATTWIRFHIKTLLSVPGFWTVSHVHAILLGRERHYVQDSESGLSCHFHTWWWMLSHENLMCLDLHWSSTFSYKLVKFMNKHRNLSLAQLRLLAHGSCQFLQQICWFKRWSWCLQCYNFCICTIL